MGMVVFVVSRSAPGMTQGELANALRMPVTVMRKD